MNIVNSSMTTKAINKILATGGAIRFKKGVYKVKDTLIICSNSQITCDEGVIFEKSTPNKLIRTKVGSGTTKYNGAHDIHWTGGTFVGNTNATPSNVMEIIHAMNVVVERAKFKDGVGRHFIEINSSKNVRIENCEFENLIFEKGFEYKEAIQIDFANYDGLAYAAANAKTYDGTHCQQIEIIGCIFSKCCCAIGTHTVTTLDKQHKGIFIRQNKAKGIGANEEGVFMKLANMKNVSIIGNDISSFAYGVKALKFKTGHKVNGGTGDATSNTYSMITIKESTFHDISIAEVHMA